MNHDDLMENAKEAITAVFSDQSVDQGTTRESLRDLIDEIKTLMDTLRD